MAMEASAASVLTYTGVTMAGTVGEAVEILQERLGLEPGFLWSLKNEDDWSFLIKLHALMEAAVSRLLAVRLGHESLLDIFANLEFANKKSGRLAFLKNLDLLDSQDRSFLRRLAELRNDMVHDVSKVGFDLKEYVGGLDKQALKSLVTQCNNFAVAMEPGGEPVVHDGEKLVSAEELFRKKPKLALWNAGLIVLFVIYVKEELHGKAEGGS